MKFIGRQPELALLEQHYRDARPALIPIYGRRRVGKSRLIDEFIKNKPNIYFLGKRTTAELQLRDFRDAANLRFHDEALQHAAFRDWHSALQTVTRLWKHKGKLVLVLDELQWTAEASPELPSVLQALWETEWSKRKDILIILCGSHVGFMEREILGEKSPLFGRRSDQIKLGPLPYPEAALMLSHYSATDRAGVYFLVGGVPAYLERFVPGRSMHEAIAEEFCSELKFFALEPHFLIREELREPARYFTILTLLAEQRMRQSELAEKSHIESRILAGYLNTMLELGYIAKAYPVVAGRVNPQQVLYEVADPLLCFWFRFIFPNLQLCRPGQEKTVFSQCIQPQLDSYFGKRFEKLGQESLLEDYRKRKIIWEHVGRYWDKNIELDVVGIRRDRWIDIGECKWGAVKSLREVAHSLELKTARYPNSEGASIGKHIYLRTGTNRQVEGIQLHTLADMF